MSQYGNAFTHDELEESMDNGLVRSNAHPEADLWILNYTEKAAYDSVWNNVTLNCRGLIVDISGNVFARSFPKFFNYGQAGCPDIDLNEPAIVTDKMDGSLGILYDVDEELAIATRGSFTSDQAIHATELLRTKYSDFSPLKGWTYLFEIVYPENRIVCDYNGMDDLIFLGAVHKVTGRSVDADWAHWFNWYGPAAEVFPYETMREALAAEPRSGKEGFVVHFLDSDFRVKIKQEDYIALHRIVTGLNARSVWQAMVDDKVEELIEQIPDEFHDFIRGVERDIHDEVRELVNYCLNKFSRIVESLPDDYSRRDFALAVKDSNYQWALFNLYDGKPIRPKFLQLCKPKHDYSPVKVSNDAD